mmetsp:Transcript_7584/g.15034  ORF Transcript_7584/g.15034 Transcript_7584/m.15034 type:complete len:222 (+) Transcript_7584:1019-1684(+)
MPPFSSLEYCCLLFVALCGSQTSSTILLRQHLDRRCRHPLLLRQQRLETPKIPLRARGGEESSTERDFRNTRVLVRSSPSLLEAHVKVPEVPRLPLRAHLRHRRFEYLPRARFPGADRFSSRAGRTCRVDGAAAVGEEELNTRDGSDALAVDLQRSVDAAVASLLELCKFIPISIAERELFQERLVCLSELRAHGLSSPLEERDESHPGVEVPWRARACRP